MDKVCRAPGHKSESEFQVLQSSLKSGEFPSPPPPMNLDENFFTFSLFPCEFTFQAIFLCYENMWHPLQIAFALPVPFLGVLLETPAAARAGGGRYRSVTPGWHIPDQVTSTCPELRACVGGPPEQLASGMWDCPELRRGAEPCTGV